MSNSDEMRRLAQWYRDFAEQREMENQLCAALELQAIATELEADTFAGSDGGATCRIHEAWERCWEDLLRLPTDHLADGCLHDQAEGLVQLCRCATGDDGIEWFISQLGDGLLFVVEQLAGDPDNPDWQRIHAALSGAHARLFAKLITGTVKSARTKGGLHSE